MKINAVSQDFPLQSFHANKSPHVPHASKPTLKLFNHIKNGFNNESPNFFRIDSMKENSHFYQNPFLNKVIEEERNSFFKSTNDIKGQIKLINDLKMRREYSQDPKMIKCVGSVTDLEILKKRNSGKLGNINTKEYASTINSRTINSDNANSIVSIKKKNNDKVLDRNYSPRNHHYIKKSLDNAAESKYYSEVGKFDPKSSSYLTLSGDYNIGENGTENLSKFIIHDKKEVNIYNCLTGKSATVKPDKYLSNKWGSFYEK